MAATAAPASHEDVQCPNCARKFAYAVLNEHLDACLAAPGQTASRVRAVDADAPCASRAPAADAAVLGKRERGASTAAHKTPRTPAADKPFAERMRPRTLDEYVGQREIVQGAMLSLLRRGHVPSMVLWGPPGSGKTTLARLVTKTAAQVAAREGLPNIPYRFVELSATAATVTDVKKVMDEAVHRAQLTGQKSVLFIDEIQRFNRAQQDVFLPPLERGSITLIAATTENPSFRLQSALLSRMRVMVLQKLSVDECTLVLRKALARVCSDEHADGAVAGDASSSLGGAAGGVAQPPDGAPRGTPPADAGRGDRFAWIDAPLLRWMAQTADGDARAALHALELALATDDPAASAEDNVERLKATLKRTAIAYDRTGDNHYDTISALHKSIRGSDANSALYWLARMVTGGDDPLFIARRLIVCASEDCCSRDALALAVSTYRACEIVGLPECGINLSHCVTELAEMPKSTRSYRAWKKVLTAVENEFNYPVPLHIRNAPTKMMRDLGYAHEYRYEPSFAHPVHQEFLPPEMRGRRFLSPPRADAAVCPEDAMDVGAATGPRACQRQFSLHSRAVDFDLLDEWERLHNDGRPWQGLPQLHALASAEDARGRACADPGTDARPASPPHSERTSAAPISPPIRSRAPGAQ
ncbi:DNA-dependent ATPase mgs1 [Malassezia sp. CBS 17886]|nr:DNA-dependent ATPase mgs1 [Malassezia sp. CBS 17886]